MPLEPELTWFCIHLGIINEDIFCLLILSGNPDKVIENVKTVPVFDKTGNILSFDAMYHEYTFTEPKIGPWGIIKRDMDKFVKYSKKWIYELQKDNKYLIVKEFNDCVPQDIINVITLAYIHVYFHTQ